MKCRALEVGQRLRIGAYLWKRPDRGGSAGDAELETALRRNLSLGEYQKAREYLIPALLGKEKEVAWPMGGGKEDLEWIEVDDRELNERLDAEEGNLREKDIDGIIEAESKRADGEEMLDSFKSFLNAISNVEGVDCMGTEQQMEENEEEEEDISLDFEKLCNVLKGEELKEPSESNELHNPSESNEDEEDVLSNLLASLDLQEGGEGPMVSILASMGQRGCFVCSQTRHRAKTGLHSSEHIISSGLGREVGVKALRRFGSFGQRARSELLQLRSISLQRLALGAQRVAEIVLLLSHGDVQLVVLALHLRLRQRGQFLRALRGQRTLCRRRLLHRRGRRSRRSRGSRLGRRSGGSGRRLGGLRGVVVVSEMRQTELIGHGVEIVVGDVEQRSSEGLAGEAEGIVAACHALDGTRSTTQSDRIATQQIVVGLQIGATGLLVLRLLRLQRSQLLRTARFDAVQLLLSRRQRHTGVLLLGLQLLDLRGHLSGHLVVLGSDGLGLLLLQLGQLGGGLGDDRLVGADGALQHLHAVGDALRVNAVLLQRLPHRVHLHSTVSAAPTAFCLVVMGWNVSTIRRS